MRPHRFIIASVVLGLVVTGAAATTAQAAPAVTIPTISPAPVPADGKAQVKASVTVRDAKVVAKWLTVRDEDDKRIVAHKKAAPGSYTVKTVVKYRAHKPGGGLSPVQKVVRRQRVDVVVATATCATAEDGARVRIGDTKKIVYWKLYSHGALDYQGDGHQRWRHTLCDSDTQWVWVEYRHGLARDTAWVE